MKDNIWNIILTAVMTALLAILGYLFISVSQLQTNESAQNAVEFTDQDAEILRQKLTDVMTDIDMRLRLIERDIEWIKAIPKLAEKNVPAPPITPFGDQVPTPDPPAPPPSEDPPMGDSSSNDIKSRIQSKIEPRYDLRR